jgi:hypothetical protein
LFNISNNIYDVNFAEVHHPFVAIYKIHGNFPSVGKSREEKKYVELLVNCFKGEREVDLPSYEREIFIKQNKIVKSEVMTSHTVFHGQEEK